MTLPNLLPRSSDATNGRSSGTTPLLATPAVPTNPDSVYVQGRAEFASVFGDLAKGKRNWQLAAEKARVVGRCGVIGAEKWRGALIDIRVGTTDEICLGGWVGEDRSDVPNEAPELTHDDALVHRSESVG